MPVHDVDMDDVGMVLDELDLVGQVCEVGGQDRRGELPHARHATRRVRAACRTPRRTCRPHRVGGATPGPGRPGRLGRRSGPARDRGDGGRWRRRPRRSRLEGTCRQVDQPAPCRGGPASDDTISTWVLASRLSSCLRLRHRSSGRLLAEPNPEQGASTRIRSNGPRRAGAVASWVSTSGRTRRRSAVRQMRASGWDGRRLRPSCHPRRRATRCTRSSHPARRTRRARDRPASDRGLARRRRTPGPGSRTIRRRSRAAPRVATVEQEARLVERGGTRVAPGLRNASRSRAGSTSLVFARTQREAGTRRPRQRPPPRRRGEAGLLVHGPRGRTGPHRDRVLSVARGPRGWLVREPAQHRVDEATLAVAGEGRPTPHRPRAAPQP